MITSTSQSAPNSERSFSRRAQSIRHPGLEVSDHRRLGSGGLRSPTKSPKSGTRLDPIILGILVSSFTQWSFDSAQLPPDAANFYCALLQGNALFPCRFRNAEQTTPEGETDRLGIA